jgi:ribosomal protein S18 acetylase RimI-like enzyme
VLTASDLPVDSTPGDIELKRIYIFSRHHGGGLARRMVEEALTAAASMGRTRMLLGVYAENHRAIAFYRKMGFAIIGDRQFMVGAQTFYDKVMARAI